MTAFQTLLAAFEKWLNSNQTADDDSALADGLAQAKADHATETASIADHETRIKALEDRNAADDAAAGGAFPAPVPPVVPPAGVSITISPATLPDAQVGVAYSQQLSSEGGSGGPYSYALVGSLPAGLVLGADGSLSGTPTDPASVGSASFSVTATDTAGSATQAFSLNVKAAAV